VKAILSDLVLILLVLAGLWPHFSTQASWLAAAFLAGVIFSLKSTIRSPQSAIWWLFSISVAISVWAFCSTSRWIVIPEQLLPVLIKVPFSITGFILALVSSGVVIGGCYILSSCHPRWIPRLLAALAIIVFCVSGIGLGKTVRQLSRTEPADFSYNFDGIRYLKSFYLMKQGMDWYGACVESTRVDARGPFEVPRVVMNYRLPTLYGLFSFLPNGGWMQVLFVLCSCCAMGAVFDAISRIGGTDSSWLCGLAASLLLGSYLLTGAVTWYYTFHEYWAWFAAAGAWFFLVRGLDLPAFALAVFSAAIREHFLLAAAVFSIPIWLAADRRNRAAVVGGWLLLVAVYLLHVKNAIPYTGQGIGEGTSIWFHAPSLDSIRYATLYGTGLLPCAAYWIPLLFVGCGWAAWRYRAHRAVVCVSVLIAVPFLGYFLVGPSIASGGYWGIVYMPWVLTLGPLAGDLDT